MPGAVKAMLCCGVEGVKTHARCNPAATHSFLALLFSCLALATVCEAYMCLYCRLLPCSCSERAWCASVLDACLVCGVVHTCCLLVVTLHKLLLCAGLTCVANTQLVHTALSGQLHGRLCATHTRTRNTRVTCITSHHIHTRDMFTGLVFLWAMAGLCTPWTTTNTTNPPFPLPNANLCLAVCIYIYLGSGGQQLTTILLVQSNLCVVCA